MCDLCLKHGAGGKWYLNARSYSEEMASKHNLREFLMEQYRNFEQISVRKVSGISPVGMDHVFRMPDHRPDGEAAPPRGCCTAPGRPTNPFRPEGHIGQVVPLEDGIAILEHCAAEPLIQKNCMCRYMTRGIKEPCCINFGVMSEIVDKLPRFIPEKEKYHLEQGRGGGTVHRVQPQGLHRHDLVRPVPVHQQPLLLREPRVRRHQAPAGLRHHLHLQGRVRDRAARGALHGLHALRADVPLRRALPRRGEAGGSR